jgi:hypothetical protein
MANFLSTRQLGISKADRDALIHVLGMLERGEVVHVPDWRGYKGKFGFNMLEYSDDRVCGTICCIAGWCDRLFHRNFANRHQDKKLPEALSDLFFGPADYDGMNAVTVEEAAIALRTYLTTGKSVWHPDPRPVVYFAVA